MSLKFAFADPPYFGCGALYTEHHSDARIWNTVDAHKDLIAGLCLGYPDGWVMCASSPSLRILLPLCPEDCRVGAWVKPFASFKPGVNPAYAWEPVIFRGGRKRARAEDTVRDWVSKEITLQKGLAGAKPPAFCRWVLDLLGYEPGDEVVDLFPGTGVMSQVIAAGFSMGHESLPIFEAAAPSTKDRGD